MTTCNNTIIVYFDEYSLPAGVEELVPFDIREVPFITAISWNTSSSGSNIVTEYIPSIADKPSYIIFSLSGSIMPISILLSTRSIDAVCMMPVCSAKSFICS